ncbi:putative sorbitol/xylitol dehydrogenase [Aspergillus sclerotiicarbonarius CBS 121057]|uniref:D-xylulose reductase n=1 Tax=Aspergillus sclerotiicarbonarius (strain CBS 121057 / IBT 28362) TaxID=1448318 RepID=A0A319FJE1_ASPSB|nr:putative sorbitol/xylitol dehydrogenase [Aspergillus sclerotiicarbonarius CBS 121057]
MSIEPPSINHALVLHPGGTFSYSERDIPTIQSDRDVLVRVVATGLCGSDIHYWQHGKLGRYEVTQPLILGHESSRIIVATGSNVDGLEVNDRVAVEPGISCNTCAYCRSGRYNLCTSMQFAATPPVDGTLCTYYRVPAQCCYKLPDQVSFRDGALVEPLSVAVHACRLGGDMQNRNVVVFGAGPVGLLCCAVARAFGAVEEVVVIDVVEERLECARRYGATHTYRMQTIQGDSSNAEQLRSVTELPEGADVVLDATGAEAFLECGIEVLSAGGTFVQVGLGKPSVTFPVGMVCDKEIGFKGSFRYGPGDYKLAIGLLSAGRVQVDGLVTHEYDFEKAEEAFQNVAGRKGIKSVIYGPSIGSNLRMG